MTSFGRTVKRFSRFWLALGGVFLITCISAPAFADPVDPGDPSGPPFESPKDDPGYDWELTPGQAAVVDRISRLEASVDPTVLESGPPSFRHGVLGTSGDIKDGYTVYYDSSTTPAQIIARVFSGVTAADLRYIKFQMSTVSVKEARAAWRQVGLRRWLAPSTKATYTQDFDPISGKVVVTVSEGSATDSELSNLRKEVPQGLSVEFQEGVPRRLSRSNDSSPHWGGADIDGDMDCTSGFTVRGLTTGARYSITAGHCSDSGDSLYSGSYFFGNLSGKTDYPAFDMARLRDSTYTNAMYTDGADPYAVRAVVGAGDGSINQALCFSGANSLSRCNGLVRDLSKRVCFEDGCTDNLAEFRNNVYSPFCNDGDSGSPVYNRNESNNRANVKGILIGGFGSSCYYHKYSTIKSHLNVEVYTG